MFNKIEWAEILKNAYGLRSERVNGILLFETRRGMEMNIVGDYVGMPEKSFFEKTVAELRVDENPDTKIPVQTQLQNLVTYRLNVNKNYETVLKGSIHQKSRNLIFKAERNGVETFISNNESEIWNYYEIYVKTMCRISAIPQSYDLFVEMKKAFKKDFILFLSKYKNKVVSGIIALHDKEKKRLHIWSNAQSLFAREVSANMATYAAVMKHACGDSEIHEIDFGNSQPGSSLAFFKERFGARKVPIWTVGAGQIGHKKNPVWPARLLRFLPVPVVSIVSRFLFKHLR